MAYSFNGTSSKLVMSGSPLALTWQTGSLWFYPTDDTLADQCLFAVVNSNGSNNQGVWYGSTSVGGKVYYTKNSTLGATVPAVSVAAATLNAWNHVYWSTDASGSPIQYQISLNGETLVEQNITDPGGTTTAQTCCGFLRTGVSTGTSWFKGYIAELALYDDTMDVTYGDRYKALYRRWKPIRLFTIDALELALGVTHYWPFRSRLQDSIRRRDFGSAAPPTRVDEHPPIRPIRGGQLTIG